MLLSLPAVMCGQAADPPLLTFDEIKQLYRNDDLPPPLRDKLRTLLTTPFVRNNASDAGMMPLKPSDPQTGKMLRVVQWNIERGLEFDAVRFAFTDPKKFNALMEDKGSKASDEDRAKIREQIAILQQGDLLVITARGDRIRRHSGDIGQGLIVGDAVEAAIDGGDAMILKPDGKELKTKIIKRARAQ